MGTGAATDLLAVEASQVSAGPLGLLVVLLMVIATVLLIRNMNSRLRRLPREFPVQPDEDDQGDLPPDAARR
jgi:small-conductance mechanosensitive channel